MIPETQPESQNVKEAQQASFFKKEVLTSIQQEGFIKSSVARTAGQFTVIQTPHHVLQNNCEGNFFTVLKTDEVCSPQNLGSVCEVCNTIFSLDRFNLPFTLTQNEIRQIEAQTKFEIDFETKLNQILSLLGKPRKSKPTKN